MVPTVVIIQPVTTITTSTVSSTLSNNSLSLSARKISPNASPLGVYQQTSVGSGDVSIRTLVPTAISAEPYRKALIIKFILSNPRSL